MASSMPLPAEIRPKVDKHGATFQPLERDPRADGRSPAAFTRGARTGLRRAVREHPHAFGRHDVRLDDHPPGRLGEDRDQGGAVAEGAQEFRPGAPTGPTALCAG